MIIIIDNESCRSAVSFAVQSEEFLKRDLEVVIIYKQQCLTTLETLSLISTISSFSNTAFQSGAVPISFVSPVQCIAVYTISGEYYPRCV